MQTRKVFSKLAILCWMGVIFWLSAQNGDTSGQLSQGLLAWLVELIQGVLGPFWQWLLGTEVNQAVLHTGLRKLAHFSAYWILAMLIYADLLWAPIAPMRGRHTSLLTGWTYTLVICGLYAVSDEVHQAFVPGRGPSPIDVGIDTLGALFGLMVFEGIRSLRQSNRDKKVKISYKN